MAEEDNKTETQTDVKKKPEIETGKLKRNEDETTIKRTYEKEIK